MDRSGQIGIPRTNASDDQVVLKEWCVASGQPVQAGQIVAYCESSKTVFELEAPRDGYLHYRLAVEDMATVGETIAYVSTEPQWDWPAPQQASADSTLSISKSALALMRAHGISAAEFAGRDLLTRADVQAFLDSRKETTSTDTAIHRPSGHRVVVVGGSGHAKTCIEILKYRSEFQIAGILDDGLAEGHKVMGVPVLGTLQKLDSLAAEDIRLAVLGIGSLFDLPARRKLVERVQQAGLELLSIVHPSAVVESSAGLGKGVQIHAGAVVSADAVLHDHCVVNTGAIVSHDCEIGSNAHIAPGAVLAGNVRVGPDALVGMGTTVFIGVEIGPGVVVKNGQHIFHDQFREPQ